MEDWNLLGSNLLSRAISQYLCDAVGISVVENCIMFVSGVISCLGYEGRWEFGKLVGV